MAIRVTVWGENVHERKNAIVAGIYPNGMHATIADALNRDAGVTATTVTLQDADHGLTPAKLAETDVLIWWGHAAHGEVQDAIVDRVCDAVWSGMGIIFLHSAHFSKPFKRLMGSPCNLTWREAGEREDDPLPKLRNAEHVDETGRHGWAPSLERRPVGRDRVVRSAFTLA